MQPQPPGEDAAGRLEASSDDVKVGCARVCGYRRPNYLCCLRLSGSVLRNHVRWKLGDVPALNCRYMMIAWLFVGGPSMAEAQDRSDILSSGPAFQSGGIKVIMTSIAAKDRKISLALSLENVSKENLFLAVIGPPLGVNGGAAFSPEAIGGVAYCIYNPRNVSVLGLDRADQITGCLKADKPQLTLDTFTLIEAGDAAPMNVAFVSLIPADLEKDFSFSMNVAVFKEADLIPPDDVGAAGAKSKPQALPKSLRYLSVGIAPLPLNRK